LNLQNDLTYEEKPVKSLETTQRVIRSKTIRMCKYCGSFIQRQIYLGKNEEVLKESYPELFSKSS